jgi:hypothetical protein
MKLGTNDIGSVYLGTNEVQKVYLGTNEVWSAFSSGLLDTYSGAAAAYSLRRLSISYTGSAIEVRRASDNATQDIGFSGEDLDLATLQSFCSGTNGFVTKWYDQSGNARNATQATAANQPQIVNSGSVILDNGKASVQFDGINDYLVAANATDWNFIHQSGVYFNFGVSRAGDISNPEALYTIWGNTNTITQNGGFFGYDDRSSFSFNNLLRMSVGTLDFPVRIIINELPNYQNANVQFLHTIKNDAGNATADQRSFIASNGGVFQNNNINSATPNTGNALAPLSLGATPSALLVYGFFLKGAIQEQIFYPSNQSSNRTGIETNINDFYSIY